MLRHWADPMIATGAASYPVVDLIATIVAGVVVAAVLTGVGLWFVENRRRRLKFVVAFTVCEVVLVVAGRVLGRWPGNETAAVLATWVSGTAVFFAAHVAMRSAPRILQVLIVASALVGVATGMAGRDRDLAIAVPGAVLVDVVIQGLDALLDSKPEDGESRPGAIPAPTPALSGRVGTGAGVRVVSAAIFVWAAVRSLRR